jgi:hypothetical protein
MDHLDEMKEVQVQRMHQLHQTLPLETVNKSPTRYERTKRKGRDEWGEGEQRKETRIQET